MTSEVAESIKYCRQTAGEFREQALKVADKAVRVARRLEARSFDSPEPATAFTMAVATAWDAVDRLAETEAVFLAACVRP